MDLKKFIVICFFGISVSFVSNTAGNEAIIGGEKAAVDQFPYQVSVQKPDGIPLCGGGIIGDKFILTAAHCFLDHLGRFHDRNNISVVAGTNDFEKTDKPAEIIKVQTIYVPTKFIYFSGDRRNHDIAMLKLEHPLKLTEHIVKKSKHIRKLELPKHNHEIYDGKPAVIAGFGWNWIEINATHEIGGWGDTQLRFAETDVVSSKQCAAAYNVDKLPESFLCARIKHHDHSKRYTACFGDSGSPLVRENTVIGILIVGPDCLSEKVQPSVYVRVAHFLQIIEDAKKDKKTGDIISYDVKH